MFDFDPQIDWNEAELEIARAKASIYLQVYKANMRKEVWLTWLKVRPMDALYAEDFNEELN